MSESTTFPGKIVKFISKYPIYVVLAVMVIVLWCISDVFMTPQNLINVLSAESGRGIMALGVCFVIISGGIDLSLASVAAFASVVAASLVQDAGFSNRLFVGGPVMPAAVALLAGLAIGLAMGAFNGFIVAYCNVPPFIATLGGTTIATGCALTYTGATTVPMLSAEFKAIGQTMIGPFPIIILYFIALIVVSWILLNKTRFGKRIYAIGGNVNAATVAGINVKKNKLIVYIWSAMLAAFAGVFLTARTGSGTAQMSSSGYELDAIAGAIVGGVSTTGGIGTIGGVVVGVLLLGVLNNGFLIMGVSPYLQQIIKGFIIVGAVAFDTLREHKRK